MIEKNDYRALRQQAVREAYWANTPSESSDLWPVSDALSEVLGQGDVSSEQIKAVILILPDKIFAQAMTWGFCDTEVRDQVHEFIAANQEQVISATASGQAVEKQATPAGKTIQCWSCRKSLTLAQRGEADGHCPHCRVEIDLD
ncbi:hypothetical protein DV532_29320 (plasmid) [Pseudomonas sp. Leaf58]|uniref:hypothetical protein n=1 Tax=unclassified Pseudomonas TaxID=196821 RepID=UPI0006F6CA2A|nr:hypothetical protein [Pseudomonas sp. Leaf58]AYG48347.1 hypothetical protein DV532_29320 [Pseudomonas sp. Leaf58]KQN62107.1 hypothetical protein ASF02_07970 [Pseudomonas sp. Leaf58]